MTGRDWMALIIPGVIWGSSFYFIAEGLAYLDPWVITPVRIGLGFLSLSLFPATRRPIARRDLRLIAALGVVWMAVPLSVFPFAEQHVSSSVTGMLNGSLPLFAAAIASFVSRRPPPLVQAVGLAIGFAGVILIALPTYGEGSQEARSIGLIFMAMVCYGVAINLAAPLQQRYGALPVIWRSQMVAFVLTAPMGIAHLGQSQFAWSAAGSMLVLGVGGTGVAFVFAAGNAGRLGPVRASVTTYIVPVVALVLGWLLRGEAIAVLAVAGSALALVGAYVTNVGGWRRNRVTA